MPKLKNQPAARLYLADLLTAAGKVQEAALYLQDPLTKNEESQSIGFAFSALLLPLLAITFYTAFFLLNWTDFIQSSGGIEALRSAYENAKHSKGRSRTAIARDKDQIAAEKILSEAFRKRFDKQISAKEHYIMEDSYFDRYPELYYPENADKNFIRLTKNISFFTIQDFEKMLPDFKNRIAAQKDPLVRYRFFLDIAYNYALFDAVKQSLQYTELALRQPISDDEKRDAYFLKASVHYQNNQYKKAFETLEKCSETIFFEAEMLSVLTDFRLINQQSLSAYLNIDNRLVKMLNRLDGDLYYLQTVFNEFEKIRLTSTDPMILFFGAEILYGMGNLKRSKTYFQEFYKSEKRVNFISFKKVAKELAEKIE